MQYQSIYRLRTVVMVVASLCAVPQLALAENQTEVLEAGKVDIVSTTPLPGIGLPLEQIPANVQTVKAADLERSQVLDITDYMNRNMGSVNINEIQGNPVQPDVNYRGFTASPLLGTPQGLSLYMDGVRMNQPFGDTVSWDLIPKNAIAGMQLIPGSNPLFGLNTLGGALSIQTKNGRDYPGGALQVTLGTNGRKIGEFEYGGSKDQLDWFVAGTAFDENGWRDKSESDYQQLFGKVGWHDEKTDLSLTYAFSDSDLNGNGLVPQSQNSRDYDGVFTYPDNTKNESHFINLQLAHYFTDNVSLTGNAYYKHLRTNTYNGDINDESMPEVPGGLGQSMGPLYGGANANNACLAQVLAADEPGEKCPGIINRSQTRQDTVGLFGQVNIDNTLFDLKNSYLLGGGFEYSRIRYSQTAEYADVVGRGLVGTGFMADGTNGDIDGEPDDRRTQLKGRNTVFSLYGSDTLNVTDKLAVTAAARYNYVRVRNQDPLVPDSSDPTSLSGTHTFIRINPSLGLTYAFTHALNMYGSYSEGSRAPTSIELGCANENVPCRLPNSMAGDPALKQVVTKTWDAGMRGRLGSDVRWNAGVFNAINHDDIQFVSSGATGLGFFQNFGETRRRGFEGGLSGRTGAFKYGVSYTYLDATYESEETVNGNFTNAGQPVSEAEGAGANRTPTGRVITVNKGDRIPLIPRNQLKLFGSYSVTSKLEVGSDIQVFSGSYVRGNESNDHEAGTVTYDCAIDGGAACGNRTKTGVFKGSGTIGGYTLVNLFASYLVQPEWKLFARVNNLFDREYATAGQLGGDPFNAAGNIALGTGTQANRTTTVGDTFVAPGAPRSAWIGVRWEFDRPKKSAAAVDLD